MKNWRPKDWKGFPVVLGTIFETMHSKAYEDGADAMLEEVIEWLKETNISGDINDCVIIAGDSFLVLEGKIENQD